MTFEDGFYVDPEETQTDTLPTSPVYPDFAGMTSEQFKAFGDQADYVARGLRDGLTDEQILDHLETTVQDAENRVRRLAEEPEGDTPREAALHARAAQTALSAALSAAASHANNLNALRGDTTRYEVREREPIDWANIPKDQFERLSVAALNQVPIPRTYSPMDEADLSEALIRERQAFERGQ